MKNFDFGRRSTADQVLAGIDLTGKHMLVTGCDSGIGLQLMNAFAANGATVIGLARSLEAAARACRAANPRCIPIACDLANFDSIAAAAASVGGLKFPLDAIVANAGIANLAALETRYGVEMQFLTNHIGHFMLVNGLVDLVRDGSGRIVTVSSSSSVSAAPKEVSRRLGGRGIAVNSADPGAARTKLNPRFAARLFAKSAAQAAATPALLAASPLASGITGEYWSNCKISRSNAFLADAALAGRLWSVSQQILERRREPRDLSLQQAA
jgi:NAD(P)-dependent dehydrogenase (short-subunit alcohol dehydrogenase family)